MKKLYKLYSIKFPEYKKVWGKLIPEEDEHVRLLKNLKVKFGENNKYFDVNEYSMGVLEYVSSFVEDELIKIKERKVEIKEALEAALSLEQSMAERKSFEMFNPSDLEIKKVFNKINRETKKHKKIILNIKTAINNRGFYIDRKTVIIFISQAFKNGK